MQVRRAALALLAGVLLVSGALRIFNLGSRDLWLDEANSVLIAQKPLSTIPEQLRLDSSPPLYYVLLHFWIELAGDGQLAVRCVSVICGMGLVLSVWWVGQRWFSASTGLMAAMLVAMAPMQVFHSQQARMYTLLPLLCLLSMYFLWCAMEDASWRNLSLYTVCTLAAVYAHNAALYLLPAQVLVLLVSAAPFRHTRRWLFCAACITAGFAPWSSFFLAQLGNASHYRWISSFWTGPFDALTDTLDIFSARTLVPGAASAEWLGPRIWLFLIPLALALVHTRAQRSKSNSPIGLLAVYLMVPIGVALAVSTLHQPNYFPGRYDQMVYPPFALLVAFGLSLVKWPVVRYGLLLCMVLSSLQAVVPHYVQRDELGVRSMAQAILQRARPGDAVVFTSLTRASVQYYLGRAESRLRFLSYPADTTKHLGSQDDERLLRDPPYLQDQARRVEQQLRQASESPPRFFLVLVDSSVNQPLRNYLLHPHRSKHLEHVGVFRQTVLRVTVRVDLFELRRPGGLTPSASSSQQSTKHQ